MRVVAICLLAVFAISGTQKQIRDSNKDFISNTNQLFFIPFAHFQNQQN
jgi:hypothetical protein